MSVGRVPSAVADAGSTDDLPFRQGRRSTVSSPRGTAKRGHSAYACSVDEEWRVSLVACVQLAGRKPVSADEIRDLLRSRVGGEVSVTAGKAGVFLYAAAADAAATAEAAAREVLAELGMVAEIRAERWDPSGRAWLPAGDAAAADLPTGQERDRGRRRLRAAGAVIAAIFDGIGSGGS